ncbi:MAG: hypothetical protein AABX35_04550 [Nanoarchaeota archaeon]
MNKRGRILPLFLIFLLVLLPFASADLQDTLQQKADNLQDKADKAEDLANTLSDKDSRTEYLSKKWGEFINKTPIGKAIILTTATVKTADPLIKLIFGAEFNFNLHFLLIFSIWLIIFSSIRKILIPKIVIKIKKFYNQFYHLIVAFILTAFLGGIKIIPNIIAKPISFIINKIPSLFTQIFLLLLISFILIWFAIRIPSPNRVLKESEEMYNIDRKMEDLKGTFNKKFDKKSRSPDSIGGLIENKVRELTGNDDKNLSLEEREKRKADTLSGLEIARKLGESLDEETEDKVKKTVERTKLDKTEKLNKTKKLNR